MPAAGAAGSSGSTSPDSSCGRSHERPPAGEREERDGAPSDGEREGNSRDTPVGETTDEVGQGGAEGAERCPSSMGYDHWTSHLKGHD